MKTPKIPILIYHALFDQDQNKEKYAIHKDAFEVQMRYIYENGIATLLLDDLREPPQNSNGKRGVVITFDDGNASDYTIATPLLKKYGLKAVFFVIVSRVGQKGYVNWDQLAKMQSDGMSIQSHSLTHPYLSEISPDALYLELHGSKEGIEKNLSASADVRFLAIPGGFFSTDVLRMAEEVGYCGVCTSVPGMIPLDKTGKTFNLWNRFTMTRVTSFSSFTAILHGSTGYVAFCEAEYFLKNIAKRLLGGKVYHAIWSQFFKNR
jgi:peptidoglycan/xylan/chitin deacetylase (PgdA/CDA1 family)